MKKSSQYPLPESIGDPDLLVGQEKEFASFGKWIERIPRRIEIGLKKTEQEIQKFETKYHISSEQFMDAYTADDLEGGDDDYVSWMGELKLRQAIWEELRLLQDVEYVTQ